MGEKPRLEEEKKDAETNEQQSSNSFVSKLTSNIEINVDGLSLSFVFKGINISLVLSNLYVHITKDGKIVE
jgi:hypothetical protein